MSPLDSDVSDQPASFEAAMKELESLVRLLEAGSTPLEEALAAYERGARLVQYCQAQLAAAEQRIRVLDADGLRDFTDATTESGADD